MGNKSALKWLADKSKGAVLPMVLLTVIAVAASFCGILFTIASRDVINAATGASDKDFWHTVMSLGIIVLLQLVLSPLYSVVDVRVLGKMKINLQKHIFGTLLHKDWSGVRSYHTGELMNRLNSDIALITSGLVEIIPNFFSLASRVVISFVYVYKFDRTFAMICLAGGPLIGIAVRIYSKRMKSLHKQVQESDGKTRSFMQECLQNLLVIKSFRREQTMLEKTEGLQQNNFRLSIKRNYIGILANTVMFAAGTAAVCLALVWCAYKVYTGAMDIGTLWAIVMLASQIQTPFRGLSALIPKFYGAVASAERIMEIDGIDDEPSLNPSHTIHIYKEIKEIKVRNMSFSYGDEEVFRNAGAVISKGEMILIEGSSGIGKSTLLKLMLGILKPSEGAIELVMMDGSAVLADKSTRWLFAYVPQGNMILSGSIKENVAFGADCIDEEAVVKALKAAEIWEFVSSLPEGRETLLGENGMGLSEGQTQRLAIARALYYDAPVILLDEATSALDEKTEKAVLANIKSIHNKTCVVISHRKAIFDVCDRKISIKDKTIGNFE